MKKSVLVTALSVLVLSASVHAAGPVALLTPVAFDPKTDRREQVKTECKLGEMLETRIGNALRRTNKGPGTTATTDGDVLKVTVLTIWGARGNNWTGPKGLVIRADLLQDGKLQRTIDLHRTTLGGFWGTFKGICGFMDRDSVALGKDLARWTGDPSFKPEQSPDPAPEVDDAASAPSH